MPVPGSLIYWFGRNEMIEALPMPATSHVLLGPHMSCLGGPLFHGWHGMK
jgi:hypothetical protein